MSENLYRGLTPAERTFLFKTKDYSGVPLEVWDLVAQYNTEPGRPDNECVSVMAAPLLLAVYRLGQANTRIEKDDNARPRPPLGHMEVRYFEGTYCPDGCEQHDGAGLYHSNGRKCEGFWHRLKCGRW